MMRPLSGRLCFSAFALLFILSAELLLTSCRKKEEMGPDVLVLVNGDPITIRDLQVAWAALPDEQKENYQGPQGVRKMLDELITWKLMAQEAKKRRLDQDPDIKERLKREEERILVNALLDRAVSDADIFRYFQENFIRCAFILKKFPENASERDKKKVREKAEEIYKRLKEGADFEELARTESDASNAYAGGDMGYVVHETLSNMAGFEVAEAVFALKNPGDITKPLEGKDGIYIFKLLEPPGNLDPRGLTPKLRNALREGRREEVIRSFANELNSRPENEIKFNNQVLTQFMDNLRKAWEKQQSPQTAPGGTAAPEPGTIEAPEATAGSSAPGP